MVVIEPSVKRVRSFLAGQAVADTVRARLVWENPHYPAYYLPRGDVRMELLVPSLRREPRPFGDARFFDVAVGGRVARDAAWSFPDSPIDELRDLVRIEWDAMDAWFEEDEEVFVHPHDPHKRIDVLHGSRHVTVSVLGVQIAETRRPTLVFETGLPVRYYFAKPDVRLDLLTPIEKRTGCAYKGFATYWVYQQGDRIALHDVAWSYPFPLAECVKIAGMIGFYNETLDIHVDGVLQPKPITEFSR
jgi:uncharacterized protein (DUF427 family)